MRSFYHFAMQYRGIQSIQDERKQLADAIFHDHGFPKQSTNYHKLSEYLEMNSPFPQAIQTFDQMWEEYKQHNDV